MASNKRPGWIMVRLRRDTHRRLTDLAKLWQSVGESGGATPYSPDGDKPALDRVIRELLARDEAHRARARKSIAGRQAPVSHATPGDSPTPA